MRQLALAALALTACTDAVEITDGVCGNGVIERDEDCDRPDASCTTACQIACDAATLSTCSDADALDGACCPEGFACGVDGVCYAPGGRFAQVAIATELDVEELVVADLDGDRIEDVLGANAGSVHALYGSTDAPLSAGVVQVAPFPSGPLSIGDITADGRPDVVIPTFAGLAAFETTSGVPEPVVFPLGDIGTPVIALGTYRDVASGGRPLVHAILAPHLTLVFDAEAQLPCGVTATIGAMDLRGIALHPEDVEGETVLPLAVAISMTSTQFCVHHKDGIGHQLFIAPVGSVREGEVLLVDRDDDPATCPDLLFPLRSATETTGVLKGRRNGATGACEVEETLSSLDSFPGYPLATISLGFGGGRTAVITSKGVFARNLITLVWERITEATRVWRAAVVGDFNADGFFDFATGSTAEDAELLLQIDVVGDPLWNAARITTGAIVPAMAAADLDGDGFSDVAIATVDTSNDRTAQLSVVYGGPSLDFGEAVPGPSFKNFRALVGFDTIDPALPIDFQQAGDVFVAYGGSDPLASLVTIAFGSASRTLESPFYHLSKLGSAVDYLTWGYAAAIGKFADGAMPGVLAVFVANCFYVSCDPLEPPNFGVAARLHRGADTFEVQAEVPIPNAADFNFIQGARYVTVSLPEGDLLLGLHRTPPPMTFTPDTSCALSLLGTATTIAEGKCNDIAAGATPEQVRSLFDVGGLRVMSPPGASPALLLVATVPPMGKEYGLHLWTLATAGGAARLTAPIDLSAEVAMHTKVSTFCMDAAPAELGRDSDPQFGDGLELVIACRVELPMTTPKRFTTKLFGRFGTTPGGPAKLRQLVDLEDDLLVDLDAGDFNGDRLDDIVTALGRAGLGSARLFLQCDRHGRTCGGS